MVKDDGLFWSKKDEFGGNWIADAHRTRELNDIDTTAFAASNFFSVVNKSVIGGVCFLMKAYCNEDISHPELLKDLDYLMMMIKTICDIRYQKEYIKYGNEDIERKSNRSVNLLSNKVTRSIVMDLMKTAFLSGMTFASQEKAVIHYEDSMLDYIRKVTSSGTENE